MSERQFAAASVGTGRRRRFAGLAKCEFLVANAVGKFEGKGGNAETLEMA